MRWLLRKPGLWVDILVAGAFLNCALILWLYGQHH